jgi:hypothetical protein
MAGVRIFGASPGHSLLLAHSRVAIGRANLYNDAWHQEWRLPQWGIFATRFGVVDRRIAKSFVSPFFEKLLLSMNLDGFTSRMRCGQGGEWQGD